MDTKQNNKQRSVNTWQLPTLYLFIKHIHCSTVNQSFASLIWYKNKFFFQTLSTGYFSFPVDMAVKLLDIPQGKFHLNFKANHNTIQFFLMLLFEFRVFNLPFSSYLTICLCCEHTVLQRSILIISNELNCKHDIDKSSNKYKNCNLTYCFLQ